MNSAITLKAWLAACLLVTATSGCSNLLPSEKNIIKSPWETFDEAKAAFDKITPYETTTEELKAMGFDPYSTPNISILNYLDIMKLFDYDPAHEESLAEGIRLCLDAKELCHAYDVEAADLKHKRTGNVAMDLLRFKRKTKSTGWRFKALIFIIDGSVVYKMWGGKPIVDEYSEKKQPLGPLQEIKAPPINLGY